MARIFKLKNNQTDCWYAEYRTADGRRKRVKGCLDKRATIHQAERLERESLLVVGK
ncbi:hypothetical protein ACQ9LF_05675 [Anaerohalosphaeraceae bacterium U12dextr]